MNFLNAIRHAAIGYGIRRKIWGSDSILSMDNGCCLWWINTQEDREARLLGPDRSLDLTAEDIQATDWETV